MKRLTSGYTTSAYLTETEDGAVTGTGFSKAEALSDLIAEAKATGWAAS